MARPREPSASSTSASTVGLPRESSTCRAATCSIALPTSLDIFAILPSHRGGSTDPAVRPSGEEIAGDVLPEGGAEVERLDVDALVVAVESAPELGAIHRRAHEPGAVG